MNAQLRIPIFSFGILRRAFHSEESFRFRNIQFRLLISLLFPISLSVAHGQQAYTFGNPSADEQLYIELINRARGNPAEEGIRLAAITDPAILNAYNYFGVDLSLMTSEFAALSPAPPLAPNAALTLAARGHSQWMLTNRTQSHYQTNPANSPGDRITSAGYNWRSYGENIFASAKDAN